MNYLVGHVDNGAGCAFVGAGGLSLLKKEFWLGNMVS